MEYNPSDVDVLPQASVAVNVTKTVVDPEHPFGIVPSQSFVQVIILVQSSVADAPPLADNHAKKSLLLFSEHVSIGLLDSVFIVGPSVSIIVYVDVQLELFPESSVTTNK